jgi:soluble lytic murein transglycosylase-like protein
LIATHSGRARNTTANSAASVQNASGKLGGCTLSGQYPESIRQWCADIETYARENGLDPNLVSAVMLQESAGQPDAYSKSGAVGLLQVMPRDGKAASFSCPGGPCFASRPTMQELFDPKFNISYGTQLLASLIQKYGDIREALKAYGPMDVGYYYADLVIGIMNSHK